MNTAKETSGALIDVLEKATVPEGLIALITILSATIVVSSPTEAVAWEVLKFVEQSLRSKFAVMIAETFKGGKE